MRKCASIMLSAMIFAASLTGCSGNSSSSSVSESSDIQSQTEPLTETTEIETVSPAAKYTGGDVTGKWQYLSDSGTDPELELELGSDGIGSAFVNASSLISINSDGSVSVMGMDIAAENIVNDGKTITVYSNTTPGSGDGDPGDQNKDKAPSAMLVLERIGEPDASTLNGTYNVTGGMIYTGFVSGIIEAMGADMSALTAVIRDDTFYIDLDKAFTYTTNGSILTINGADTLMMLTGFGSSADIYYTAAENTLDIETDEGYVLQLFRADE